MKNLLLAITALLLTGSLTPSGGAAPRATATQECLGQSCLEIAPFTAPAGFSASVSYQENGQALTQADPCSQCKHCIVNISWSVMPGNQGMLCVDQGDQPDICAFVSGHSGGGMALRAYCGETQTSSSWICSGQT